MDEPRPSLAERARTGRARVTATAQHARRRAEAARPRSAAIDTVFGAVEHDTATGGPVLAGAVAFRIFLVLIPYVFVVVVTLGFSTGEGTSQSDLARRAGITGLTASAVEGAADLTTFQRVTAVVLGLFALVLATRTAIKVLRITHALIWGVRPTKGPWVRPMLVTWGLISGSLLFSAVLARVSDTSLLLGVAGMALAVVVPTGVWLLASLYLPHGDAPWWALLPGAVVVGVGIEVLHFVTVFWIARSVTAKADLYGTIGAALALLLWAYLLGRVFTMGAVVNASLWRRQQRRLDPAAEGGGPTPIGEA